MQPERTSRSDRARWTGCMVPPMPMLRCVPLAAVLFATSLAATPSASSLIDRAKAAANSGAVDTARDLAPIMERLASTRDTNEQDALMSGIEDLGAYDGTSPAAVKAYLRTAAPPVLLTIARGKAPGSVRCKAFMLLRTLNVPDAVLDQAIAIANSDTSADQQAIRFRGKLLEDWKATRLTIGDTPVNAASGSSRSPATEQEALKFLRQRGKRVSPDSLSQAALHGDALVMSALLDAGIDVNAPLVGGMSALDFATGIGCFDDADLAARLATVDVLLKRGADVKGSDDGGNTVLMRALDCPAPVVARLIAAGASVDAVNAQNFAPLQVAFAKGKWDIAKLLVDNGARLSRKAIDALFFEKPADPEKLALIQRAITK
jgi:hypothetical protein